MFEYIIIGLLVLIIPLASLIMYEKGKKAGAHDFFQLIAEFGYDSKVKTFRKINETVPKGGIVFLGDSITQDFNVYELFAGRLVYNRGIGGDTTEGVLKRLDVSVYDLKPRVVIILIGTNDFALLKSSPKEVYERTCDIIKHIHEELPLTKIILQSVYPVNETLNHMSVFPRNNRDIDELNSMLKTISNVTYLDLNSTLKDDKGRFNPDYTLEGLHVSPLGYQLIHHEIEKLLIEITTK
jgi:lysophospholipase L1-like esterase